MGNDLITKNKYIRITKGRSGAPSPDDYFAVEVLVDHSEMDEEIWKKVFHWSMGNHENNFNKQTYVDIDSLPQERIHDIFKGMLRLVIEDPYEMEEYSLH
jgi:hypothetical protein